MDHTDDQRPATFIRPPASMYRPHPSTRRRALYLVLTVGLAVAGCGTPRPPRFQAQATPLVNRDVSGAPLSVVVRAYQLSDRQAFDRLGFDSISGNKPETEALGQQLLAQQEWVLTPGGSIETALPLEPHTRYVGLIGFFIQPDAQGWRLLADATAIRAYGLRVEARECYLVMMNPTPLAIPGQSADHQPDCGKAASVVAGR